MNPLPVAEQHQIAIAEELGVPLFERQSRKAMRNTSRRIGQEQGQGRAGKEAEEEES